MNNIKELQVNRKRIQKIQRMQDRLRIEKFEIKEESNIISYGTIKGLLETFIGKMKDDYEYDNYIQGRFSDGFTKFVSRRTGWGTSFISKKHKEAQEEYMEALKNLNVVFVDELLKMKEQKLTENLCNRWSIKNLENVDEDYIL